MKDWININQGSIVNDRALLLEFIKDFEKSFNQKLSVGCIKCIKDAYNRLTSLNSNKMAEVTKKSEYVLNPKYYGSIQWKGKFLRPDGMTDKLAKDLIKNHPRGEKLFTSIPKVKKATKKPVANEDVKK